VIAVAAGAVILPALFVHPAATPPPSLATVSRRSFTAVVTVTGSVVPNAQVNVNFSVSGRLTTVAVNSGDHVKSGQLLGKLDDTVQRSNVSQALAQLQGATVTANNASINYGDVVASVNLTNQQNTQAVAAAKAQQDADCGANPTSAVCADDQAKLAAAMAKQQQDLQNGQTRIHLAQGAVDSANAQVTLSRTAVATAQANLAQTVLYSPTDGIVLSVSGGVGETVTAGATTGSQAPGSTAPQPGGGQTGPGGAVATAPGNAFVVIGNSNAGYQVVAPFAEADAARIKSGMTASVTFDAVANLKLTGHILAIAPSATVVANVVNYYVTIALDASDPRLQQGMTSTVTVPVATAKDVLGVPNQAVYQLDQQLYADVWYHNQQVAVKIQVGLIGDQLTEIVSGLREGQQVVLTSHHNSYIPATPSPGSSLFGR
jgi:multidrug efflux pump subunit AcrA (membrane-fusion protein)